MKPVIEFKGSSFTLMVLHLFDTDSEKIAEQLADKISKSPMFFQNAPIVIDLQAVQDEMNAVDLVDVVKLLRRHSLIPVAVRGGNSEQHEMALSMDLGLLIHTQGARPQQTEEVKPEIKPVTVSIPLQTKIIQQPVRSGQRIEALGDVIVLSSISQGAEILARGNIHIYGALHGRALAGAEGDNEARIFCQQLNAELLSIAGEYQINEKLPKNLLGKAAQIYLEEGTKLKIVPLGF